jgi:outer membrane protein OmpA-like peptidoglycan-associated protein
MFRGDDLEVEDIEGGCMFLEISEQHLFWGKSGYAMLLGVDPRKMQDELYSDVGQLLLKVSLELNKNTTSFVTLDKLDHLGWFESSAKGVLVMVGDSKGLGLGAAALGHFGYIWTGDKKKDGDPIIVKLPSPVEIPKFNYQISQRIKPIVEVPGNVFDFNKDVIRLDMEATLHNVGVRVIPYQNRYISIGGHTDNIGNYQYNIDLSERRAEAVKKWLVSKNYLINPSKVFTKGFGYTMPVASNKTKDGQQKNRRVDIIVLND